MANKDQSDKKKLSEDVKAEVEGRLDESTKGTEVAYACGKGTVFKCKQGKYECEHPDKCVGVYEAMA